MMMFAPVLAIADSENLALCQNIQPYVVDDTAGPINIATALFIKNILSANNAIHTVVDEELIIRGKKNRFCGDAISAAKAAECYAYNVTGNSNRYAWWLGNGHHGRPIFLEGFNNERGLVFDTSSAGSYRVGLVVVDRYLRAPQYPELLLPTCDTVEVHVQRKATATTSVNGGSAISGQANVSIAENSVYALGGESAEVSWLIEHHQYPTKRYMAFGESFSLSPEYNGFYQITIEIFDGNIRTSLPAGDVQFTGGSGVCLDCGDWDIN